MSTTRTSIVRGDAHQSFAERHRKYGITEEEEKFRNVVGTVVGAILLVIAVAMGIVCALAGTGHLDTVALAALFPGGLSLFFGSIIFCVSLPKLCRQLRREQRRANLPIQESPPVLPRVAPEERAPREEARPPAQKPLPDLKKVGS